jgi:hypothetical protein
MAEEGAMKISVDSRQNSVEVRKPDRRDDRSRLARPAARIDTDGTQAAA